MSVKLSVVEQHQYKNIDLFDFMVGKTLYEVYNLPQVHEGYGKDKLLYEFMLVLSDDHGFYHLLFEHMEGKVYGTAPFERSSEYSQHLSYYGRMIQSRYSNVPHEEEVVHESPVGREIGGVEYEEYTRHSRCGHWEVSVSLVLHIEGIILRILSTGYDYDAREDEDEFFYRLQVKLLDDKEGEQHKSWMTQTMYNGIG